MIYICYYRKNAMACITGAGLHYPVYNFLLICDSYDSQFYKMMQVTPCYGSIQQ